MVLEETNISKTSENVLCQIWPSEALLFSMFLKLKNKQLCFYVNQSNKKKPPMLFLFNLLQVTSEWPDQHEKVDCR